MDWHGPDASMGTRRRRCRHMVREMTGTAVIMKVRAIVKEASWCVVKLGLRWEKRLAMKSDDPAFPRKASGLFRIPHGVDCRCTPQNLIPHLKVVRRLSTRHFETAPGCKSVPHRPLHFCALGQISKLLVSFRTVLESPIASITSSIHSALDSQQREQADFFILLQKTVLEMSSLRVRS